ncbi:spermidine synthase [Actinomadura verrucosospora]|uniref:Spermidine synthase n=1 Tax=Actinomadura verrucosospora TaxID=46165 RepID=A0A7D3ZIH3_ACTVE|nr:spermidine synthase [Actinomadura verrucosospora]QKG19003.1 spermidine synthase [Actinomadura verrucosospora]
MDVIGEDRAEPVVVERAEGVGGELVLRRAGADYEIISNGMFLMDTRNGESERLLVRAAVDAALHGDADGEGGAAVRVLIGGLGVGFSLAEALALPAVGHVTVVEREPAVVGWHAGPLRPWSRGGLDDPRTALVRADLLDVTAAPPAAGTADADADAAGFDAVCLDIDNGPHWTVTPGNARLYGPDGLDLLARRLTPRGVLAVWSAGDAPGFQDLLASRFAQVEALPVPVPRGEPDMVYLARRPRPEPAGGPGRGA